jgi:hydroxymethylbilane synthase
LCKLSLKVLNSIKIGTRGSKLALWQANWVKTALEKTHSGSTLSIITIKTTGDKILNAPLAKVGGKGLFVKEIEESLLNNRVDLAVHSMKDMPARIPTGLTIGAIPKRENPKDVLISKHGKRLFHLASGSRIGTSSLRRSVQLRHARPDLVIVPLRGNLDTRIRKLEKEDLDAVVLAAAGVIRMNFEDRITEYLDEEVMLPAVGQGALCIEIRANDPQRAALLAGMDDPESRAAVTAERAFLSRLEGSCQIPVAAYANLVGELLVLKGLISDLDGKDMIRGALSGPKTSGESIGVDLANRLLDSGGRAILETIISGMNKADER